MKSHSYDSVCRAGLKTTDIKREQIEVRDHLLNVKYIKFSDMYTQDFPSESISTVEASDRHFEIVKPSTMEIQLKVPTLSLPSSILTLSLSTFPTLNPLPPLLATSQSLQHELEFERMFNLWLKVRIWKQTSGNKNSILQV